MVRSKIMKLAKVASGLPGMMNKIDENAPEYYVFSSILTDEEADVAIAAGLRKQRSLKYLADKVKKPLDEVKKIADRLAWLGVLQLTTNPETSEDQYYMAIFAPGILENMVNNDELLAAHPEVGRAFDDYTNRRIATMAPMFPDGHGLMRVVPIESSLKDIKDIEPFERISDYLDKFDTFSVSNCSCRASRRVQEDGCGHLEDEMCVQFGRGAENYIRTGKGRAITREEADEIIKRAEANGLMHCMPNIEEAGDSSAVCNCCSCSCFALRGGMLYGARDAIRSNFVAEVDEEKCVACGRCVETCPANSLRLGQKIPTDLRLEPEKYRKMRDSVWKESDWNVNYRENRQNVVDSGTAPCKAACPAHIAVQGYLQLAAKGEYKKALALIKRENPFPAVCGRICDHRCETHCTRKSVDDAVAIDEVKRFIADSDLSLDTRYVPPMLNQIGKPYEEKIAIIGAGPAGMSCAFFLAEKGYRPTVFEKESRPGGMLMNGIPTFRLEKDVVQAEIDILEEMGVEFRCNVEVGKDITIQQLRDQGYKGFYIAIGAQGGRSIGIPGENAQGVLSGVDFLKKVSLGTHVPLKGKTVIIGGGNVAIDVARTALRDVQDEVNLFCLESRETMPASEDEVLEAEKEGVVVHNAWGPQEILTNNGQVTGIVFKRCLSAFDEDGKFNPRYDENDLTTIACDNVLVAIGQSVIWGKLLQDSKVEINRNGTVQADKLTYQTAEPDIFAGGDVYTGPKFAIDGIAAGKEGAISLHRFVHPGQTLTMGRDRREFLELDREHVIVPEGEFDNTQRQLPGYNTAKEKSFGDARVTFTEEQVKKEASRCLKCGAVKVDQYLCVGCGLCTTRCDFDAIHMVRKYNWKGDSFEKMPIKVAGHVLKKAAKVAAKPFAGDK